MNDNSPPADHPAVQSAIYHLTLALIRSGSLKPAELTAAARRVADEGKLNDPEAGHGRNMQASLVSPPTTSTQEPESPSLA